MHITDYNRLSVLTFLGNAASQISESVLIDIGRTVHKISLEEARKEVEISNERNYNNFNTLMRENKNKGVENNKEENIENEGGTDYGTDISSQGGLPVSEPDRRGERSDNREIRDASEDIPEGTQEQPVSEPVPDRKAEQHLAEIEKAAQERMDSQMEKLLKNHPAPDKEADPMAWTAHMNALMATAEESILTELVYS